MITYKHLGIYEILSMLEGDLSVYAPLLLEVFDENPEHKALVIKCSNNEITYQQLLERVSEIV
jgi:hypothetical protein